MQITSGLLGPLRVGKVAVPVVLMVGPGLVTAAPASGGAPGLEIRWHGCGRQVPPTLQCGELAVPRDYRHPRGAKIRLGFNRLRAQDRKRRVGSLIVNPGGPGGAGSDVVALEAAGAGSVASRAASAL